MKKKTIHISKGKNPAVVRHKAEKQTGEKQPHDGYFSYYRDISDGTKYFESIQHLFETDELTPEEQELFMDFSKAVSNIIGHGHMLYSGRVVPVELKKSMLVPLVTLGNIMVLIDNYAARAKDYWKITPLTDPERRIVVITMAIFETKNLVNSCAQAGWDFFKSKAYFDSLLESTKNEWHKSRKVVWGEDDDHEE